MTVDRALLRIPYLGRLMRMYATSQLARTLSTLLSGGLPLLNALEVAGASIGNRAMAAAVTTATPQIREGKSLTAALESTRMLENLALEMVKVGEQTGALGEMLNAVAEFYDEELDTRIATVLQLVEPIMLVLMAVIVAAMLLAFYLPLFQVFSHIH
jgi:type IV pilus assembly protein PilC